MSRGIHPAILSLGGLGPALKAVARRSPVPVGLDVRVRVRVEVRGGALTTSISDDGVGGADPSRGSGLIGLLDRVEASGGTISISSPAEPETG